MTTASKRGLLLIASLIVTFVVLRLSLYISPNSNFDVGQYNIHHLFTGLVVLTFAAIPLLMFKQNNRFTDLLVIVSGIGLSMALDEWVYLIATDGSDAAYLLPVSFWGGVIVIGIVVIYIALLMLFSRFIRKPGK